jgi:hypothetical protein
MHPTELLDQLADLARAAGLEVREIRGAAGEGDFPTGSGICRVKGRIWVLLAVSDSLDERIDVLGPTRASSSSRATCRPRCGSAWAPISTALDPHGGHDLCFSVPREVSQGAILIERQQCPARVAQGR